MSSPALRRPRTAEHGRFVLEAAVFAVLALGALGVYQFFLREPRHQNVILISIDTLRPDHLGCYGYGPPTSPNIDRLASRGTRFERVHSSSTWTLPAHMSLMTGLPDALHGVLHDSLMVGDDRRMLAECFQTAGYKTAGFFGGPYLSGEFGFNRGFSSYTNCGVPTRKEVGKAAGSTEELNRNVALMEQQSHRIQTAERTENEVEAFLTKVGDQPFFLFIHHWDVHYDFTAPQAYVRMFAPDYQGTLDPSNFMSNPAIHPDMDPADYAYLLACYDAEIRWVDFQIGRLLQRLDELKLTDDTLIVITGDHGEEFFEHGSKGHRLNLHEETLRIPLIVAGPTVHAGQVIEHPVRIFDIMPTLLDMAGLAPVPAVYGMSLAPHLRGADPEPLRALPMVSELTFIPKLADPDAPQGWREPDYYDQYEAFSHGARKLMDVKRRAFDPTKPAALRGEVREQFPLVVYDLDRDPREAQPITDADVVRRMQEFAERVRGNLDRFRAVLKVRDRLDTDLLEQLRQAGYLGAALPVNGNGR